MLPPTLHLAAPRALALSSPQVLAATAVIIAPTAYKLALELSGSPSKPSLQLHHHRHFHWWCRRLPSRHYASWGRHNPIDGTEQRPLPEYRREKAEDDLVLSPREKLWKAKMEMINKMMRSDAYEGLFGPSNRMLRGLNWRSGGWQKLWEEQWKDVEQMHGVMKEEARSMLKAFQRDLKYSDSQLARQAEENGKVKEELARAGWEYDAITNKMVQRKIGDKPGTSMPGRKEERRNGFVEIPVKPYTERNVAAGESMPGRSEEVRTGFADIPLKQSGPKVEIYSQQDAELEAQIISTLTEPTRSATASEFAGTETGSRFEPTSDWPSKPAEMSNQYSRRIPVPTIAASIKDSSTLVDSSSKIRLPKSDLDLLTVEDVRARMGHTSLPTKESSQQKESIRAELDTRFEEAQKKAQEVEADLARLREQQAIRQAAFKTQNAESAIQQEQWRLQREQLKEAAADFQIRERRARKEIRELHQFQQNMNSRLTGLQGRSDGLVRSGSLSPRNAVSLHSTSAALQADAKVLSKANALITAAVQTVSKASQVQAAGYVEPSLARYAWDKKPFTKIRDAEELVQNVSDSLRYAEEAIKVAETKLEKSIQMAGALNAEVEKQRLAMRGHEEKWRWRQDSVTNAKPSVAPAALSGDARLVNEIKGIYEDEYGAITPDHTQAAPARELTQEEELAAMSLGGIPEISPASFDGGMIIEKSRAPKTVSHPQAFSGIASAPDGKISPVTPDNEASELTSSDPRQDLNNVVKSAAKPITQSNDAYYSTRLQSPASSMFQGLRPKKVEPIFSGEQGGHANYEKLRHRMRDQRRRRTGRGIRKFSSTVVKLAAACYLAGVLSEWLREANDGGDAAKQERDFATGQTARP